MKIIAIIFFILGSVNLMANHPYRAYLLSKISYQSNFANRQAERATSEKVSCIIPRFERPKGAVFCRMEDYLTTKTKIWIKVGVK